ncbi:hypothetical protein Kpho02_42140 [Kitasatospora phosalacinea]|uniref:Uncharacterized protein n=1 Tax=Kitasatospora phosalacinea TaxID=2065 RepID=A0A9W6V4B1_9ACTN|nr:hypothetical protein Kpho02_42140 [Kitasatospora phosalacinea]
MRTGTVALLVRVVVRVVVLVLGHRDPSALVPAPEVNPRSEQDPKAAVVTVVVPRCAIRVG